MRQTATKRAVDERPEVTKYPLLFRDHSRGRKWPYVEIGYVQAVELDAIVLLGCRVGNNGEHSRAAQLRAERAALAFRDQLSPLIVVSGGRRWDGISEAEALALRLAELGVPKAAIVRELSSLSTCENARFSSEILRERSAFRIGLVTSDWHMPRALLCFAREGFAAVALPAESDPVPKPVEWLRSSRERLSFYFDSWITWGSS